MFGATLKIDGSGFRELASRFERAIHRTDDFSDYMDEASAYLVRSIKNRIYRTKKGPDGTPWAANKESTIKRKGHGNILVNSRTLANSIYVSRKGKQSFTITADARNADDENYAIYVQNPTRNKRAHNRITPGRPFMGISKTNVERLTKMLHDFIDEGWH